MQLQPKHDFAYIRTKHEIQKQIPFIGAEVMIHGNA